MLNKPVFIGQAVLDLSKLIMYRIRYEHLPKYAERFSGSISVVADQIGTPTYAPDLAFALLQIIGKVKQGQVAKNTISGIWNYSNEGVASWYDFAVAIFDISNIACHVKPIETKDYPTPAKRPAFSVLNKAKIKTVFQLEIPHWRTSLEKCLSILEG